MVCTRKGLTSPRVRDKEAHCHLYYGVQPVICRCYSHAILVRFSEDGGTLRGRVHLVEHGLGENEELVARVRRVVWDMPYADDPGIVSTSVEGLGKMMSHCYRLQEQAPRY